MRGCERIRLIVERKYGAAVRVKLRDNSIDRIIVDRGYPRCGAAKVPAVMNKQKSGNMQVDFDICCTSIAQLSAMKRQYTIPTLSMFSCCLQDTLGVSMKRSLQKLMPPACA